MVTKAATSNDYSKLKSRIRAPRTRLPSYHIYGKSKVGKTYFCASAPDVLILDPVTEDGTAQKGIAKMPGVQVLPIESWEDFDELYRYIKKGDHSYQYLAFDGMTKFNNMALHHVRKQQEEVDLSRIPGQVSQPDYFKSGELVKGMLNNFHTLPVGKIYTSHEKRWEEKATYAEEDENATPQPVRCVAELPDGVRSAVNAMADVIGRMYKVKIPHPEDMSKMLVRRRLWLGYSERLDTGFRSEWNLPDFLPTPTVPRLAHLIEKGTPK